jgi:hypothetical protein
VSDFHWVRLPIRFTDLPIPESTERPGSLEKLDYSGFAEPLSVEVLARDFTPGEYEGLKTGQLEFRIINRSNKAVWTVNVDAHYKDASGDVSDELDLELKATETLESLIHPAVLVDRNATEDIDADPHHVQMRAEEVDIRVRKITFMDGTVWQPEEPR